MTYGRFTPQATAPQRKYIVTAAADGQEYSHWKRLCSVTAQLQTDR